MITRRKLLEWRTARDTELTARTDVLSFLIFMWVSPAVAISTFVYLALMSSSTLPSAGPFLVLWFVSPMIAWWLSRPLAGPKIKLSQNQIFFLRKVARKTWAFFETYVGPEDHWLPPDNYQEAPVDFVAHRTSPTNIGISILSNLAAYDFGYASAGTVIDRVSKSFETLRQLDRYRGHF